MILWSAEGGERKKENANALGVRDFYWANDSTADLHDTPFLVQIFTLQVATNQSRKTTWKYIAFQYIFLSIFSFISVLWTEKMNDTQT